MGKPIKFNNKTRFSLVIHQQQNNLEGIHKQNNDSKKSYNKQRANKESLYKNNTTNFIEKDRCDHKYNINHQHNNIHQNNNFNNRLTNLENMYNDLNIKIKIHNNNIDRLQSNYNLINNDLKAIITSTNSDFISHFTIPNCNLNNIEINGISIKYSNIDKYNKILSDSYIVPDFKLTNVKGTITINEVPDVLNYKISGSISIFNLDNQVLYSGIIYSSGNTINYLISSRPLFPTGFTINCILNIDMQIVSL